MSFEEAYKEYLVLGTIHLKKQSIDSIFYNFNSHICNYFKNKNMCELTKRDFSNWKNQIYELQFSNSYNNTLFVQFNNFLNYCFDNDYIRCNFLKELGNFNKRIETNKSDYYTLKEFNRFIKGFDNNIYRQYFNLLFYTGLRPSEAMALKLCDLKGNYLIINKSIQRKGNRSLDTTKNQSSIRTIKIDNKLKKDLLKLVRSYNLNDIDLFIFGGLKPLSPTTIDRYKLNACNKMNIRPITQHQFRHSHATLLLNSNIPITEISRRLGHSKVSTTLDIYTHTNLLQEKRVTTTLNFLRINSIFYNFNSIFKHF